MTETEELQHFGWLLIDLIYDLSVPAVVFRDYLQHDSIPKDGQMFQGVSRMCKFSVIIAGSRTGSVHLSTRIKG
jgi:hypothetical protein